MIAITAHIAGLPVEETVLSFMPVAALPAAALAASLRRRRERRDAAPRPRRAACTAADRLRRLTPRHAGRPGHAAAHRTTIDGPGRTGKGVPPP